MNCPNCGKPLADGSVECQNCGLILAKWATARNHVVSAPARAETAVAPGASGWPWGWLLLLAAGAGLLYWWAYLPLPWLQTSQRWEKIDQQQFDSKVLKSPVPVFVYFDAVPDCRGADGVFFSLQGKHKGKLRVVYVDATTQPQLADVYGATEEVIFSLIKDGREVKRSSSAEILDRVTAKNNGSYSEDVFLEELENFISPI